MWYCFVFFYLHPHKCLIVQFHNLNSWGWPQKWHRGTVDLLCSPWASAPRECPWRGGASTAMSATLFWAPPKGGCGPTWGPHCRPGTCLHCRGYNLRTVRDRGDLSTPFYRQFSPKNQKKIAFKAPNPSPRPKKLQFLGVGPMHQPWPMGFGSFFDGKPEF